MLKGVHSLKRASVILVFALFFSAPLVLSMGGLATAETRNVKTTVTVKPSLLLDIPTNNITMNLDPSSHAFEERDLTIKVGTNNLYGYKLFLTTPNDDTDLVNVADSSKTIPNLTSSTSVADFPVNNWGYRFTPNATSSTGNYGVFTSSDSIPIMSSDVPVNEQASTLGFAAKIDYTKPSGLYNLKLNFKAVPTVTTNYMQDIAQDPTLANTICTEEPTVVIDKRDEQAYTIRRINGTCWMVENLQFTGTTMDSTTSNIAPEYTPANPYTTAYYDLDTDGGAGKTCSYPVSGWTSPCIHKDDITVQNSPIDPSISSTTKSTVWYNYVAATAGTITGSSNTDPQFYDICPAGWRIPNLSEIQDMGNNANIDSFAPTYGGYYNSNTQGHLQPATFGSWWSSAAVDTAKRWLLHYNNGNMGINDAVDNRASGRYIRCVLGPATIGNLTYMQDFTKITNAEKTQLINNSSSTTTYNLIDNRDSQSYGVAKLADGKIWQVDNLNLGATTLSNDLTSSNTNLSTTAITVSANTFNSWKSTTVPSSTSNFRATPIYYSISGTDSTSNTNYGTLYTYCVASANTICAGSSSDDATSDICPAGWRLPVGGDAGETVTLSTLYNDSLSLLRTPIASGGAAFSLPGDFAYERYNAPGVRGMYWTSTCVPNVSMKDLALTPGASPEISPNRTNDRGNGFSIRCIAK